MRYVGKYCRTGQDTDNNKIWRMRNALWITKATNTHTEYVTLIVFPLQQWLHERNSTLRLCVNCVSCYVPAVMYSMYVQKIHQATNSTIVFVH